MNSSCPSRASFGLRWRDQGGGLVRPARKVRRRHPAVEVAQDDEWDAFRFAVGDPVRQRPIWSFSSSAGGASGFWHGYVLAALFQMHGQHAEILAPEVQGDVGAAAEMVGVERGEVGVDVVVQAAADDDADALDDVVAGHVDRVLILGENF